MCMSRATIISSIQAYRFYEMYQDIMNKPVVTDVSLQPIGPIFKGQAPLKMGPIGCYETSVTNYRSTLRNIPEEQRLRVCLGGKWRMVWFSLSPYSCYISRHQDWIYGIARYRVSKRKDAFCRREGPRSRSYGRTAALRLTVQPLWWRRRQR
jgi:hypothetical protein